VIHIHIHTGKHTNLLFLICFCLVQQRKRQL
jgi:hypothetical protein